MFMLLGPLHSSCMPKVTKATAREQASLSISCDIFRGSRIGEKMKGRSWVHISSAACKPERVVTPEHCS